ncbi:MAG: discoidin domain-containing protein [Clostridia bacterium]|nr:discoidin domain-containing protein [Clostridia bacterium]
MKTMKQTLAVVLCLFMLVAVIPFSAFAAPSYWGYDSYDTIQNPGINDITSYPTTLTKISASKYSMSCTTDAGKLTVTLEEKSWGMFNLGSWTLVDTNGKTITFLSASTDWEYVYRTKKTESSAMVWSGGNHGNEVLVSLDFYNGDTEQKISLSNGQSVTANKIHIIEKSKLLFKADTDNDGYGYRYKSSDTYTDADVYANVTRKYTITGPQVKLNVDYDYVKDVFYQLSYTCMFPIDKQYGLYCDMYDQSGNMIKHIETKKVGSANYDGPQYSGNAATRAHIYGYVDQRYQFNVMVNTPTDSLENFNNAFKTSYWDMNTTSNKIYFSKYDSSATTKITSGTQYHTECAWQFVFDPDANPNNNSDFAKPNLARGKNYQISITNNPVKTDSVSYAANLTDGVALNTFAYKDDSWFIFSTNQNADKTTGIATVTIPLNKIYHVTSLRLHLGNFVGIKAPKSVKAYAKIDDAYVSVGSFDIKTDADTAYWTELNLAGLNTDEVKLEFTLDGQFAYINEIEVHGGNAVDTNNIALRKEYTVTGLYPNASSATYPDEDGITMTDGIVPASNATYKDTGFIGMNSGASDFNKDGYGSITVDLKKNYNVEKFVAYVASSINSGVGIKAPLSVSVYVSADNEIWEEAGEVTPTDSTTVGVVAATVLLDEAIAARYVQFRFVGSSNWVFVGEVEVYEEYVPEKGENLAFEKNYTTTAPNRGDIRDDDGVRLTDGVKGTTDAGGAEYAGWNYIYDNGVDVIIDLGKSLYTDTYTVYFAAGMWGIVSPKEFCGLEISVSDTADGEFKSVATANIGDAVLTYGTGATGTWSTYTLTAETENSVKGRYVKIHISHAQETPALLWIDEVEVYQNNEPATEPVEPEYILGDVNNNKKVDSVDYLLVKRACFKTYTLSKEEEIRANINKDNAIDSTDYLLVKRIAFGTYTAN